MFSVVALPAKTEKLALKDLPKPIKASRISKKNFRATIEAQNVGIEFLRKTAVTENNSARSIHDLGNNALKRGSKLLDDVVKKMTKLENLLSKSNSRKILSLHERIRRRVSGERWTPNVRT